MQQVRTPVSHGRGSFVSALLAELGSAVQFVIDAGGDLGAVLGGEFDECSERGVEHSVGHDGLSVVVGVEGDAFEHDLVEGLALFVAAASVELISPAEELGEEGRSVP